MWSWVWLGTEVVTGGFLIPTSAPGLIGSTQGDQARSGTLGTTTDAPLSMVEKDGGEDSYLILGLKIFLAAAPTVWSIGRGCSHDNAPPLDLLLRVCAEITQSTYFL